MGVQTRLSEEAFRRDESRAQQHTEAIRSLPRSPMNVARYVTSDSVTRGFALSAFGRRMRRQAWHHRIAHTWRSAAARSSVSSIARCSGIGICSSGASA